MDSRTKGIIATVATALLCGCPGLFICVVGGLAAAGAQLPTSWAGNSDTGPMASTTAFALLCAGIIFIIIPIVVGFVTLRKKPAAVDVSGPVPPAA